MGPTPKYNPAKPAGGFKNSNFAQAWLVLVLALSYGAALAAVQVNFSGIIAANRLQETLEKVPQLVWGAETAGKIANQGAPVEIRAGTVTIKKDGKTAVYSLYRVSRKDKLAGWVIRSGGQGYADRIELLVGLDPDAGTITGLFILEQKETPGLGNKITLPRWRSQFVGQKTHRPLTVGKGKSGQPRLNTIDAVTGATISSRSVAGIVNRVIGDIKGQLTPETIRFSQRKM